MDEDPKKGVWLEPGRTLEHYLLRDNVSVNFSLDVSSIRNMSYMSLMRYILCNPETFNLLMSCKRYFDTA